ncbi:hypothetical protein F0L68_25475 [Solihabitans fulvus]|uniref:YNCE-like beta-propeller domain-containing protein n=1 Tax=Solihabitans fulvus TaxID=1892852 RepID=A0A5B2X1L1_9PSEU|nr:hypothetical protein [Solihabitans fulvus]KAA2257098.1 hypothetical protein F0L68_25475 [Solihabitans fulvus]
MRRASGTTVALAMTMLAALSVGAASAAPAAEVGAPRTFLYVPDEGTGSVSVIDAATGATTATILVGASPNRLVAAPDGRHVYVASRGTRSVATIDTRTNRWVSTVKLPKPAVDLAVSPDGSRLYASEERGVDVDVIDTGISAIVDTVLVADPDAGDTAYRIAMSPDGSRLYANTLRSNLVRAVDTSDNAVVDSVELPSHPSAMAVSPDNSQLYTAQSDGVSIVDTDTMAVSDTESASSGLVTGLAVTPDGAKLYGSYYAGDVVVVDAQQNTTITTISTPKGVGGSSLTLSGAGDTAYVTNAYANTLTVIDTASNTVTTTWQFPAGTTPRDVAVLPSPPVS